MAVAGLLLMDLSNHPLPLAMRFITCVLIDGAATHPGDPWRYQTSSYHLRKAVKHLILWRLGARGENHRDHALARLAMAVEIDERETRARAARLESLESRRRD